MDNETLFARLGGQGAIEAAVEKFYDKVLVDDVVKDFFKNTDMKKQRAQQKAFLTMAFGGPNNYTGKDMRAAHAQLKLTDAHFDKIIQLLGSTLAELGVSNDLIKEVADTAETLREDTLGK